ncbi:FN3 associated domain-containing protein [Butyrivibrio sp. YAB3001]|uniref:FN3 associated domain-containing protein n=1 Tax=Butyrivibrio sp. YAB3001 TaxID=1520812 RepID=UPI0008F64C5D|nr:FN3 associated domain-containing protein [Butyrivibrio sp. YAB3001]SFD02504.1 zinc-ribbon domain-containing protein [Butyrivibrio sp. YAB3001]
MKCPECGFEIPEGHMYCDNCGTEINFVPEFEPEVENEINQSLSGVADELNKEERLREEKRKKRLELFEKIISKRYYAYIAVVAVLFVVIVICAALSFSGKTSFHYLRKAENSKNAGDIEKAIQYLVEGNESFPDNSEIIFRLSDYYLELGKSDEAVEALKKIADSDVFDEQKVMTAYEGIISIYEQSGDYSKLTSLFENNDNSLAIAVRDKYIPSPPEMTPVSGEYDDTVVVSVYLKEQNGQDKIYYTVNDGVPDELSIHYDKEIVLDTEGKYSIKAICINQYGIQSEVTERTFVVVKGKPSPPDVLEPSGEYNQNTMIVAVTDAYNTIFYTTDGSDPTITSKQYISPITMPVGTSHFKFVAIDEDGQVSDIVEREYHLVYTRLVSKEQAVNSLVSTLVRLDYLLDNSGKVRGVDGHNEYIYNSEIEIAGAGEYYVVVEYHVSNDGTSAPTGLLYAVNTHDGSVNRLGYDSSGKYTLLKISNR